MLAFLVTFFVALGDRGEAAAELHENCAAHQLLFA